MGRAEFDSGLTVRWLSLHSVHEESIKLGELKGSNTRIVASGRNKIDAIYRNGIVSNHLPKVTLDPSGKPRVPVNRSGDNRVIKVAANKAPNNIDGKSALDRSASSKSDEVKQENTDIFSNKQKITWTKKVINFFARLLETLSFSEFRKTRNEISNKIKARENLKEKAKVLFSADLEITENSVTQVETFLREISRDDLTWIFDASQHLNNPGQDLKRICLKFIFRHFLHENDSTLFKFYLSNTDIFKKSANILEEVIPMDKSQLILNHGRGQLTSLVFTLNDFGAGGVEEAMAGKHCMNYAHKALDCFSKSYIDHETYLENRTYIDHWKNNKTDVVDKNMILIGKMLEHLVAGFKSGVLPGKIDKPVAKQWNLIEENIIKTQEKVGRFFDQALLEAK
ncbi:hypothetical protein [Paraburkholderia hayleyella]|uniref:hypothetical protein n=1 Tax=Paraburkholderia hayleyella TaxID=2152889 RepID=UPI001291BEA5|nr:hypothetical protein [Paraburkholderia hayleyella]